MEQRHTRFSVYRDRPALTRRYQRIAVLCALFLCVVSRYLTVNAPAVDYVTQVKPLLRERCYSCHGTLKQESGLRLDSGALIRQGGDSGPIVLATDPSGSPLLERISAQDPGHRMPPIGKPLSAEQIQLMREWVAAGSPSPADEQPEEDPRQHWAFRLPVRPTLPIIPRPDWAYNPIDQLVYAVYDREQLTPAQDADPAVRLRRVYLDLIGLPPDTAELAAFLEDPSQDHYLRVVDRLLASPQYGERWGRHWMDVWRYSDWYGRRKENDVRNSAPQIWRWRDWIVNSLNQDKSYARMVEEMLAADELAATDDSAWPATGYLIRNYYSLNPNEWMRHSVEYTGKAFLGLTFNCAHCHDHKYDPITHEDYFRMRAFFEPLGIRQDRIPGQPDPPPYPPYVYSGSRKAVRVGMVRVYDERPDVETWFYTGGDERNKDKQRGSIAPGVPAFLADLFPEIKPVNLPLSGWYPGARPNIQKAILEEQQQAIAAAEQRALQLTAQPVDTRDLEQQVTAAQDAFQRELAAAIQSGQPGALVGKQSLYLEAVEGRRIVQNELPNLKTLPVGTEISFQLRILQDQHVNFQLARDTVKGLTALYVSFVAGTINSYRAGTEYQEFVAGTYNFSGGENHFKVTLVIDPPQDQALLSVQLMGSDRVLVKPVPIALNGWNPTSNPNQPFTFDCRTGTKALVDQVTLVAGKQKFSWGFEPPRFTDGEDVAGIDGWVIHPQSIAPASSFVSMIAACESARESYTRLKRAETAFQAASLGAQVAQRGVAANRLKLVSLQATIAADNAQRVAAKSPKTAALARAAYRHELAANLAMAQWQIMEARFEMGRAQALPDTDQQKAARLKQYEKQLATARKQEQATTSRRAKAAESAAYTRLSRVTLQQSTGRRSSLARWITHPRNPLTPRVAVNHIWLRHFQSPLVESVYDFGRNGKTPTHPALLDWLAVELVANQWSMKHLHRLMVTSHVYQLGDGAAVQTANREKDRDNRWLWHRNQGRMEAEVIRDSLLFLSGRLNQTLGGQVLLNTESTSTRRRSLYYEVYPEAGGNMAFAELFDPANPGECFRRSATVVPQQALALSNSQLIHAASAATTRQIDAATPTAFIHAAFRHILARNETDTELAACLEFWKKQQQELQNESQVRESLVRVLFNHNDFVTIR